MQVRPHVCEVCGEVWDFDRDGFFRWEPAVESPQGCPACAAVVFPGGQFFAAMDERMKVLPPQWIATWR